MKSEAEVQVQSILNAIFAAGWVVVPRSPTQEMLLAAWASALAENAEGVWRDMIAASPELSGIVANAIDKAFPQ